MKQFFLSQLLFALVAVVTLFTCNLSDPPEKVDKKEKISGAFEALNFLGNRQTYPLGKIPERGYSEAWEYSKSIPEATPVTRENIDPWETMGPHNRGGRTLALAFNPQNPNTLYAGSASGGLWRSYSAGVGIDAWERVDIDFPVLGVSSITFVPGDSMTMYIGTGEVYNYFEAGTGAAYRDTRGSFGIGILKSVDGGITWEKSLDWSQDENHGVWAIRVAQDNPNLIYAATTDGVYKSTDAGENWTLKHPVKMANDLLVHPDNPNILVVGCGNLGSDGHGIYRSTDGGENWNKIFSNLPQAFDGKVQLGMAPSQPNTIYASIGNGFSSADGASWLCRSDDFGSNWTLKNTTDYSQWQGWFAHDVAVHPGNPDEITVIGIYVWNSMDGGTSLLPRTVGGIGFINPPIEGPDGEDNFVHTDAHDVIYHPENSNIIYIANDGGIHRSLDGGYTYASCNGRYQTAQFYNGFSTSQISDQFCMGGLQDNGTIRWNGDETWSRISGGDGSWTAIHPSNDFEFYTSWQFLNILKTTDDGVNMDEADAPKAWPYSFIAPFMVAPSNGDIVYAASSVMAKSEDGALSWTVMNNGNSIAGNETPVLSMAVSWQNPNVVYAATAPYNNNTSQVTRTLNGSTWTNITGNLPTSRYPMDMCVDPTDDGIVYVVYAGFGTGHVFKSTNHGATWTDITNGLPDVPTNAVEVDPLFPNTIYVGNDLGVFVSTDGGENWETYQDGLPNAVMVFDLKISPVNRKLRVATHGNGAYQRDLLDEAVTSAEEIIAGMEFSVFPNPVEEELNISLKLQESSEVLLELYGGKGQLVRKIFSGEKEQGTHLISVKRNHLPAGNYILNFKSAEKSLSKKVILK